MFRKLHPFHLLIPVTLFFLSGELSSDPFLWVTPEKSRSMVG